MSGIGGINGVTGSESVMMSLSGKVWRGDLFTSAETYTEDKNV